MNFKSLLFFAFIFLYGCSTHSPQKEVQTQEKIQVKLEADLLFDALPNTYLKTCSFNELPSWNEENFKDALANFVASCKSSKTQELYGELCKDANLTSDPKVFIENNFAPYVVYSEDQNATGLLTGYFEPEIQGSLKKTKIYKYPVYETPKDLIVVDLSSIYPDLQNYRLRGKIEGNKLIPYDTRKESASRHVPANVICYTDSKIDLFFLEIQGSGRVRLDDGSVIYIGYDNQNGHKYRAIGRYLVEIGAMSFEEVSLQSIRAWLHENPHRVDEVLNYNDSVVYFKQSDKPASGSLGVCLSASRSVAVDKRYIPLGSMLYLNAHISDKQTSRIVLAQDTGGAIKGAVRADLFLGCGKYARETAGKLKSELKLWILLPKDKDI